MFTQRAVLLGFVAFCFYLIAVVNTLPSFYYVLMWLAIGLLAASLGIAFLSLSGLDSSGHLARARGHAAGDSTSTESAAPVVEASLRNRGSLNKTGIVVELGLRDVGRERDIELSFLLEAIAAGRTIEIALPLRDLPRGRYLLQNAQLIGSDVLGLFRTRRRVEWAQNGEIVIGPALISSVATMPAPGGRGGRRGAARRARPGVGDELHGTRPYVAGDDLRHIHWKTTARTGELAMREWERNGQGATLIVWDGALNSDWGAGASSSVECGLILAASLASRLAEQSLPYTLALLGEQSRFCAPTNAQMGAATVEALADARAARVESLASALEKQALGAREFETLIVITASLAPDVEALARAWSARDVGVSVALVNGAALGMATRDARFDRRAKRAPRQSDGPAPAPLEVSGAAYETQAQTLRRAGARVVECAPRARAAIWPALESALETLLHPDARLATQSARASVVAPPGA